MLIFISGGVRSGKSTLGERLANKLAAGRKVYLATSRYYDEEMERRIEKHQNSRANKGFLTIEKSENVGELDFNRSDTVLLDCLGTLTANEMFNDYSADFNEEFCKTVIDKIYKDIMEIVGKAENMIIISNEIFSDGISYDKATEAYIFVLGALHVKLAKAAEKAIECAYGFNIYHRGEAV